MDSTTIGLIIVAVLSVGSTIYTQKQTRKAEKDAHEIDVRKVDAEAYDKAQQINSSIIASLQAELTRLQELLSTERRVSTELRQSVKRLEDLVRLLKRALEDAHIPIPLEARDGDGAP